MHALPQREPSRRPIPTRWLSLSEMSATAGEHGLDTLRDFERRDVPLAEVTDAERVRVAQWAARAGGPLPQTVTKQPVG